MNRGIMKQSAVRTLMFLQRSCRSFKINGDTKCLAMPPSGIRYDNQSN
jgi:hypothetical protein